MPIRIIQTAATNARGVYNLKMYSPRQNISMLFEHIIEAMTYRHTRWYIFLLFAID